MAQPARKKDIMVGDIRITYLPDGHGKIDKTALLAAEPVVDIYRTLGHRPPLALP